MQPAVQLSAQRQQLRTEVEVHACSQRRGQLFGSGFKIEEALPCLVHPAAVHLPKERKRESLREGKREGETVLGHVSRSGTGHAIVRGGVAGVASSDVTARVTAPAADSSASAQPTAQLPQPAPLHPFQKAP